MRVALCDDETDENRSLKALIDGYALDTGADLTCECFTDPAGLLSKDRYDLYFLDYIMPAMTGSELAVKLREKFGGAVTVCFLTSYEKAAVDVINRNIDAQAFLLKPVEKAKLTALLEKLSERSDLKRLVLKKDQTMTVVYPRDILRYFSAFSVCFRGYGFGGVRGGRIPGSEIDRKTENGTLTLSADSEVPVEMPDFEKTDSIPWNDYIPAVTRIVVGDNIVTVGDLAFYGCGSCTEITLPCVHPGHAYPDRQDPRDLPEDLRLI